MNLKPESLAQCMPEVSHLGFDQSLGKQEAVTFTLQLARLRARTCLELLCRGMHLCAKTCKDTPVNLTGMGR